MRVLNRGHFDSLKEATVGCETELFTIDVDEPGGIEFLGDVEAKAILDSSTLRDALSEVCWCGVSNLGETFACS